VPKAEQSVVKNAKLEGETMDIRRATQTLTRRSVLRAGGALGIGGLGLAGGYKPAFAAGNSKLLPAAIITTAGSVTLVLDALMKQEGFFTQMGVDATTQSVADGSKVIAALLGGGADLCGGSGFSSLFPAMAKGAQIKILSGAALSPVTAVFAKSSDIKSVKDLEGKTYGVGPPGALLHELAVALMTKKGVDYTKVTFVNIGSTPDVFKAVVAGRVDAGPGEVELYDQQSNYGVHSLTDGVMWDQLPEYTNQAMFATDETIAAKRETLVRCMAAYAKMFRFVRTPAAREAWRKARATALGKDEPAEALSQWEFYARPNIMAANLEMDQARVDYVQNLNVKLDVQKAVLPMSQVADLSLARDALKLLD
jgi:ABC-type nitrate/sulfonate/bicarbonate transport system substrate-binding protein